MKLRIFPALLLVSAITGCVAPYYARPGTLPPVTTYVAPELRLTVWRHAISVLLGEGFVPYAVNDQASYIAARYRDDGGIGELIGSTAIVVITPDNNLHVDIAGHGIYGSSTELVRDLAIVQNRLTREILAVPGMPQFSPPSSIPPRPIAPAARPAAVTPAPTPSDDDTPQRPM